MALFKKVVTSVCKVCFCDCNRVTQQRKCDFASFLRSVVHRLSLCALKTQMQRRASISISFGPPAALNVHTCRTFMSPKPASFPSIASSRLRDARENREKNNSFNVVIIDVRSSCEHRLLRMSFAGSPTLQSRPIERSSVVRSSGDVLTKALQSCA